MSIREMAEILGVNAGHLSRMINGKHPWNMEIKARYDSLVGNGFGNSYAQSVAKDGKKEPGMGGNGTYLLGTNPSNNIMVSRVGFEPTTLGLKVRCSAN